MDAVRVKRNIIDYPGLGVSYENSTAQPDGSNQT